MILEAIDLFSGVGGFSLGMQRAGGFETKAFCEIDPWCRRVLNDNWPDVPCHDDVRTFNAVTRADIVWGGFPCQDASIANTNGKGASGERTGLFRQGVRIARDVGARGLLMENVPELLNRGFGDVLGELARFGFDAEWECISARLCGANHLRNRLWILAYPTSQGRKRPQPWKGVLGRAKATLAKHGNPALGGWRSVVSGQLGLRMRDGLSITMERRRLHQLGNAILPDIAEEIGREMMRSEAPPPPPGSAGDAGNKDAR